MTLINADGGEAEISGNGLRCLSAHLWRSGLVEARHVVLTAAGERAVEVAPQGASTARVTCELGRPILASAEIPVRFDPPLDRVVDRAIDVDGRRLSITATSLGNPHCALFLPEPADDALLRELGPRIERHPLFPRRTNVEFVTVVAPAELRVRFWERGVGYTSASGTGAASAAVAAILGGRAERRVTVVCDGGRLEVEWPEGQVLRQTGEVVQVCAGEWQGAALAARQRGEG
jgi:diaminopimelate epimerase